MNYEGRNFRLWDYSFVHHQLLLRSYVATPRPNSIDIAFAGVKYVDMPIRLSGLRLCAPSRREVEAVRSKGIQIEGRDQVSILESDGRRFVVVAAMMWERSNMLGSPQSSLEYVGKKTRWPESHKRQVLEDITSYRERKFQLWDYYSGHDQLLLRSCMGTQYPTNTDIVFIAVKYVEIPTSFEGLQICAPTPEETGRVHQNGIELYGNKYSVFALETGGYRYTVVAAAQWPFVNTFGPMVSDVEYFGDTVGRTPSRTLTLGRQPNRVLSGNSSASNGGHDAVDEG